MDFFKQQFAAEQLLEGQLIPIDKPIGWTSFQVVNKVRGYLKNICKLKKLKVGHAGTLDPLATGLLLLCTGKMTKSISEFQNQTKEYTGTIMLGATTPSYDLETEIDHSFSYDHLTVNLLKETLSEFLGNIEQYPPLFSAVKKRGKRLYEYARSGEAVEIEPRIVKVNSFELTQIEIPEISFLIHCGKGVYIRSLAHDFGKALHCGGHLTALRRTAIGDFRVDDAYTIT